MFRWFESRGSRRRRVIERGGLDDRVWGEVVADPLLAPLDDAERARLRDLALVFLDEKRIEGCRGFPIDDTVRTTIAARACLLVLELGIDALGAFDSVLVYPSGFRSRGPVEDELGVVTDGETDMLGEAWDDGPVVISWADLDDPEDPAFQLVLHECAHQIDLLTGDQDGVPPLRAAEREGWAADFDTACADLAEREAAGEPVDVDPYAAENRAEAFAVFTETFFGDPLAVREAYPAVYDRLQAFYRQDPIARLLR